MSEIWKTKYGPRRVRQEAPTLDEAIFAAKGLTDDAQEQIATVGTGRFDQQGHPWRMVFFQRRFHVFSRLGLRVATGKNRSRNKPKRPTPSKPLMAYAPV